MPTPLHLPGMLCGLTGSVFQLRVWVKTSFETSGLGFCFFCMWTLSCRPQTLGFCFKHASAKAGDGVRERDFGFPRGRHFVMKVILGNAAQLPNPAAGAVIARQKIFLDV